MITKINKTLKGLCALFVVPCSLFMSAVLTSCEDFFDQESEHVIFADQEHLNSATDSIYSVTGILNKLQALADRTILLGEVRGDLVDITNVASSDLRDLATFNVGDDNMYNSPRDYYAVINNCNYFIAHADTALKNNRNEYIFMKEYAAVKAIRAWTYLQLVLNYGSVPFVTLPILTKDEAEADYPRYDLQSVCDYFINDLMPLSVRYGAEYPGYGTIRNTDSRLFWFPIDIVMGDLNLWYASATGDKSRFKAAAESYYKYLYERNGLNSAYPISSSYLYWKTFVNTTMTGDIADMTWTRPRYEGSLSLSNENYSSTSEIITMIGGDSILAEGNYSQLRNLFNSREENDYKVSLTPSKNMFDISESQMNCCVTGRGTSIIYSPIGLPRHMSGDLRLSNVYTSQSLRHPETGDLIDYQSISKYSTRNVHIYRRQMVYLRLAEALNQAGYPRMAFQILSQGINNDVVKEEVYPYYSESDSLWISKLDFPVSRYGIYTVEHLVGIARVTTDINTIGIHSRGSGWTPLNEYYQLPVDTLKTEAEQTPFLQEYVDNLILQEGALEFAFEGTRYYDLMRFALRKSNPGAFLSEHVWARKGKDSEGTMRTEIKKDLTNQRNWYLQWNGKIGLQ